MCDSVAPCDEHHRGVGVSRGEAESRRLSRISSFAPDGDIGDIACNRGGRSKLRLVLDHSATRGACHPYVVPDGPIARMHPWGDMATNIHRAIWREAVRVRLTGVPSLTPLLAIALGAVIGGLFLLALRYPDRVRAVGLPDVAGWAGLMWLTTQISVAAGLLLFC